MKKPMQIRIDAIKRIARGLAFEELCNVQFPFGEQFRKRKFFADAAAEGRTVAQADAHLTAVRINYPNNDGPGCKERVKLAFHIPGGIGRRNDLDREFERV